MTFDFTKDEKRGIRLAIRALKKQQETYRAKWTTDAMTRNSTLLEAVDNLEKMIGENTTRQPKRKTKTVELLVLEFKNEPEHEHGSIFRIGELESALRFRKRIGPKNVKGIFTAELTIDYAKKIK